MKNLKIPTNFNQLFPWLKEESEKLWEHIEINRSIYGFQLQQGTKWLSGLNDEQIANYEKEVRFAFPEVYKTFLKYMNGTDRQAVNVYGESGESYGYGVGYYSYPRDIQVVKDMIGWVLEEFKIKPEDLDQEEIPHIMPILGHRFLVMDRCETNPVLSMHGNDTIIYADSLNNFLVHDIFSEHQQQPDIEDIKVKFWLN